MAGDVGGKGKPLLQLYQSSVKRHVIAQLAYGEPEAALSARQTEGQGLAWTGRIARKSTAHMPVGFALHQTQHTPIQPRATPFGLETPRAFKHGVFCH